MIPKLLLLLCAARWLMFTTTKRGTERFFVYVARGPMRLDKRIFRQMKRPLQRRQTVRTDLARLAK